MKGGVSALSLIFSIHRDMAVVNTNKPNHIFPIWLKNDSFTVEDDSADITLPVDTSLLIFDIDGNTDNACTLPNGTVPGQIMTLWMLAGSGTNYATVTVSTKLTMILIRSF